MTLAASIRFLDGKQPRLTHVPPVVRSSVMTEVLPSSCARNPAAKGGRAGTEDHQVIVILFHRFATTGRIC
jgi:hypothetical protein